MTHSFIFKNPILFYLAIFCTLGIIALFTPLNFTISNPLDPRYPIVLNEYKEETMLERKLCNNEGYFESYTPNPVSKFFIPLTGVFYGQICDKTLLFLADVPYYIIWALLIDWLFRNIPFKKSKYSKSGSSRRR